MPEPESGELIRVRGLVQGVGFRPVVWRLAHRYGLRGWVGNDGGGVTIAVCGRAPDTEEFLLALRSEAPPLARIDAIERTPSEAAVREMGFRIAESEGGTACTGIIPDAAICPECRAEIGDPRSRRYRYPFANCTHCGPRFTIVEGIPYDRATTTMRAFTMCEACAAEYADPSDRRFHAQPIACAECGPHLWLEPPVVGDAVEAARLLIREGRILAVKGLGGFHLACDAGNAETVARLRSVKRRDAKPFALMARDLAIMRKFAVVMQDEAAVLQSPAAPIVLLQARNPAALPGVAPGLDTLGFMLPNTPLHELLLEGVDRPLVMTSGNLSEEPQCTDNADAARRLGGIADFFLLNDRDIARRVDDSVVRVMAGTARLVRRARGYAPASIRLPQWFGECPPVLAMGGELKATFCLLRAGEAILSHQLGDLENPTTFAEYCRSIEQYRTLFAHNPSAVAVDLHPDYLSRKFGLDLSDR